MKIVKIVEKNIRHFTLTQIILYGLVTITICSIFLGAFSILPYKPVDQLNSLSVLSIAYLLTNYLFVKLLKKPAIDNIITINALILFYIFTPVINNEEMLILFLAGIIAMVIHYLYKFSLVTVAIPSIIATLIIIFMGINHNSLGWDNSEILIPLVGILCFIIFLKLKWSFNLVIKKDRASKSI